jgi:hypothetical protein
MIKIAQNIAKIARATIWFTFVHAGTGGLDGSCGSGNGSTLGTGSIAGFTSISCTGDPISMFIPFTSPDRTLSDAAARKGTTRVAPASDEERRRDHRMKTAMAKHASPNGTGLAGFTARSLMIKFPRRTTATPARSQIAELGALPSVRISSSTPRFIRGNCTACCTLLCALQSCRQTKETRDCYIMKYTLCAISSREGCPGGAAICDLTLRQRRPGGMWIAPSQTVSVSEKSNEIDGSRHA